MSDNKDKYLKEAIRIGDELLAKADKNNGLSWKTMSMGADQKIEWHTAESIYTGAAGIVYFFLELYRDTKNEKYLNAVLEGVKWIEKYCEDNPTTYYSFYTGRMGVSYLLLQVAEELNDERYKTKALAIAEGCEAFLDGERNIDDLINGISGTLLGLLHLHAATGAPEVLERIKQFTNRLIDRMQFGEEGIYWDRSSNNIQGLCGFSHGAGGIGYVFLELGKYFQNDTFYWIAEQAFAYENHLFSDKFANWPDLRKGIFDTKSLEEHREHYMKGNKDFFRQPGDMAAWCHGAPGIGLSRVRAYELLKKDQYLDDLHKAVNKTKQLTVDMATVNLSYTLCHGGGGNAILFLEADRLLNKAAYRQWAATVANYGLEYKKEDNEYISGFSQAGTVADTSLFMGDAGVGYYYLLASQGLKSGPSILKPDVEGTFSGDKKDVLVVSLTQLFGRLADKLYPETTKYIGSETVLNNTNALVQSFKNSLTKRLQELVAESEIQALKEIWKYERLKCELDESVDSHSYAYIKRIVEIEKNRELMEDEQTLLKATVFLPEDHVVATSPTMVGAEEGEEEDNLVMLMPTADGLAEFPLNYFAYVIIQKFEKPAKVEDVVLAMTKEFDVSSEAEVNQVKEATINQIKEAMTQGIVYTRQ